MFFKNYITAREEGATMSEKKPRCSDTRPKCGVRSWSADSYVWRGKKRSRNSSKSSSPGGLEAEVSEDLGVRSTSCPRRRRERTCSCSSSLGEDVDGVCRKALSRRSLRQKFQDAVGQCLPLRSHNHHHHHHLHQKKENTQYLTLNYIYRFKYYIFIYVQSYKTKMESIFGIFTVLRDLVSQVETGRAVCSFDGDGSELKNKARCSLLSIFFPRGGGKRDAGARRLLKWCAGDCSWIC